MEKRIHLKVLGITYSQIQSGAYALVLAEESGNRRIPIIIGTSEAQSIAIQLEHLTPPRPLTHDLFMTFAQTFEIRLKEVFIYKFQDGVFSSEMLFEDKNGVEKRLDSRTSDAIACALRSNAPIYTTEEIVQQAGIEFEEESLKEQGVAEENKPVSSLSLEELNNRLKAAVQKEDYEEASHLRDQIRKLQESKNQPESDDSAVN